MKCSINDIVESTINDKSVKSYKEYTMAVSKAECAKIRAEHSFLPEGQEQYIPMMYVIVQRSDGRFTPVFLQSQFLNVNGFGGYIMELANMGFITI